MYDVILKNGIVLDGTGKAPYKANIALFGDSIAFITDKEISRGKLVLDIAGEYVAPGFIDSHCHTDFEVLRDRKASARIGQGITTDITGNCGIGVIPYVDESFKGFVGDVLGEYADWAWSDFTSMKHYYEKKGLGANEAFLISHSAIRVAAMGMDCLREASAEEVEKMCAILRENLKQGAYGFSSGLYYAPCVFADHEELKALLTTVKEENKLFAVHHRCEGTGCANSLKEVLDLAEETGVRLEVSHLKAIGDRNQDQVDVMLEMIEAYRKRGVDVKFDQYPYVFGSTSLFSLLPPRILAFSKLEQRMALSLENERQDLKNEIMHPDGWDSVYEQVGPEKIKAIFLSTNPQYNGMTLTEIAVERGSTDPLDALFDILSEETGLAVMTDVTQTEENLMKIMKHPLMCFGTDSLYSSPIPHPRSYHSTVEFLSTYVRDKGVMPLPEAIRKMTGETASRFGLKDRGLLEEGKRADLVVFSLEKLKAGEGNDNEGLSYVFVNGKLAYDHGSVFETGAGRVL